MTRTYSTAQLLPRLWELRVLSAESAYSCPCVSRARRHCCWGPPLPVVHTNHAAVSLIRCFLVSLITGRESADVTSVAGKVRAGTGGAAYVRASPGYGGKNTLLQHPWDVSSTQMAPCVICT